ncbi:hypothetical protein JCM11641_008212 [Rhodosporidiobolus odoratus]
MPLGHSTARLGSAANENIRLSNAGQQICLRLALQQIMSAADFGDKEELSRDVRSFLESAPPHAVCLQRVSKSQVRQSYFPGRSNTDYLLPPRCGKRRAALMALQYRRDLFKESVYYVNDGSSAAQQLAEYIQKSLKLNKEHFLAFLRFVSAVDNWPRIIPWHAVRSAFENLLHLHTKYWSSSDADRERRDSDTLRVFTSLVVHTLIDDEEISTRPRITPVFRGNIKLWFKDAFDLFVYIFNRYFRRQLARGAQGFRSSFNSWLTLVDSDLKEEEKERVAMWAELRPWEENAVKDWRADLAKPAIREKDRIRLQQLLRLSEVMPPARDVLSGSTRKKSPAEEVPGELTTKDKFEKLWIGTTTWDFIRVSKEVNPVLSIRKLGREQAKRQDRKEFNKGKELNKGRELREGKEGKELKETKDRKEGTRTSNFKPDDSLPKIDAYTPMQRTVPPRPKVLGEDPTPVDRLMASWARFTAAPRTPGSSQT